MAGTLKNYYEILGVPRSANADQIRTAYRKLLLKFHPDKNMGDAYFEDWSKKVIEAFEVLIDPRVRAEYDKVCEETRFAARQMRGSAAEGVTVNEKPQDVELQKIEILAPKYITAKQAYFKTRQKYAEQQEKLNQVQTKNRNAWPVWVCVAVLVFSIGWGLAGFRNSSGNSGNVPVAGTNNPAVPAIRKGNEKISLTIQVVVPKAYFYNKPQGERNATRFLSSGNKANAIMKNGDYYYAVFQSMVNPDYKVEGWLYAPDVKILQ